MVKLYNSQKRGNDIGPRIVVCQKPHRTSRHIAGPTLGTKRLRSPDRDARYRMTLGAHRKREQGDREDNEAYLQVLLEIYQKGRLIKSGAEMKNTINSLFVASRGNDK